MGVSWQSHRCERCGASIATTAATKLTPLRCPRPDCPGNDGRPFEELAALARRRRFHVVEGGGER